MKNLVVLVSGNGTNLQALIDAIQSGVLRNCRLAGVVSNNERAYALERGRAARVPTRVMDHRAFASRETFGVALLETLRTLEADVIALAGFLVVLPPVVIEAYPNRIVNVHPSLIPSFCGKGSYGLKIHQNALARGVKISGATVHLVDQGTDTGPILLQKAVPVLEDDTPETLQQRIMQEAEYPLLVEAIQLLVDERVEIRDGRTKISPSTE